MLKHFLEIERNYLQENFVFLWQCFPIASRKNNIASIATCYDSISTRCYEDTTWYLKRKHTSTRTMTSMLSFGINATPGAMFWISHNPLQIKLVILQNFVRTCKWISVDSVNIFLGDCLDCRLKALIWELV